VAGNAWDRLPEETPLAFNAFKIFLALGPGRTIAYAAKQNSGKAKKSKKDKSNAKNSKSTPQHTQWYRWAKAFKWEARAKAYDDRLDHARQATEIKVTKDLAAQRLQRREQVDENAYSLSEALTKRAREILDVALERSDWRLADVVAIAQLADRLGRMSAGMPTDQTKAGGSVATADPPAALHPALAARLREASASYALEVMGSTYSQPDDDI
jgi:hypothetical protein